MIIFLVSCNFLFLTSLPAGRQGLQAPIYCIRMQRMRQFLLPFWEVIEVLAVAYKLGYTKIYEAPIKLNFKGASSITSSNFWNVIFSMLWDTAAVFYRLKILKFYDKKQQVIK